ncbi:hypothetical protein B7486_04270 [cyanobacterium TDX16]|nr:hypothetical protein B7486_04270 [cyanobacterium TDX16]
MLRFLQIPVAGQAIAASLHIPEATGGPWPLVVCCHGLTGTRIGSGYRAVSLGRGLEELGVACLRFDFRGCGESDGRFLHVTAASLTEDLRAVLGAAKGIAEVDTGRLGIYASSFGAFTAARVAHEMAGLRCLVFIAPVADPCKLIERDMTPEAWGFLRREGWIDHHGLKLGEDFFVTMPREDGSKLLAGSARPALIFHGTGDYQVPFEHGQAYEVALRGAGAETRLEAVDSKDHGLRGAALSEGIVTQAVTWFGKYLRG